jgi:NADH:ubiquinone oxidoreductase subunit 4 (subunit M)
LSACYLLWSYQRVFFGEVTQEKNKTLPDASGREKFILVTMSLVMLWMGIGSTYFTRRTAAASQTVIDQVEPQRPYEAAAPSKLAPSGVVAGALVSSGNSQQNSAAESANR